MVVKSLIERVVMACFMNSAFFSAVVCAMAMPARKISSQPLAKMLVDFMQASMPSRLAFVASSVIFSYEIDPLGMISSIGFLNMSLSWVKLLKSCQFWLAVDCVFVCFCCV